MVVPYYGTCPRRGEGLLHSQRKIIKRDKCRRFSCALINGWIIKELTIKVVINLIVEK